MTVLEANFMELVPRQLKNISKAFEEHNKLMEEQNKLLREQNALLAILVESRNTKTSDSCESDMLPI